MKICWDNLENIHLTEFGNFRIKNNIYIYKEACACCGNSYLTVKYKQSNYCSITCAISGARHPLYGKTPSNKTRKKMSVSAKLRYSDEKNPNYKGGVEKLKLPLFNTFSKQIIEVCRCVVDNENRKLLQVRCVYCNNWFTPTINAVRSNIAALNLDPDGRTCGDAKFYCSEGCKEACPTFRQRKYPKGFKQISSREINPLVRQMCFERDNWTCQICDTTQEDAPLHCHHVEGYSKNPRLGNDVNNTITLCKACHKEVHKLPGCNYYELRCNKKEI